ncbi:MAG: hypothetical protein QXP80_00785 [Zestosphaera sp.]
MRVKIYLCIEHGSSAIVHRHHVPSYSVCEEVDETDLRALQDTLPSDVVESLIKKREFSVSDLNLVEGVTGKRIENSYVKLILVSDVLKGD